MTAARESERDWKAATFSLTVRDVASALDVSAEAVVDLMVSGSLGFWMPPASPGSPVAVPAERARFDPEDVSAWRDARPRDSGAVADVLGNLRSYLEARWPPQRDYDVALASAAPLAIRGRLYVRTEVLTDFARSREAPLAAQFAQTTERVLSDMGAVRRRGIRPEGERTQRWAVWWRLPDSVWNGGEALSLSEFLGAERGPGVGAMPEPAAEPLPLDGDAWTG